MKIRIKYFSDRIEKLRYIGGKSDWIDLRAAEDISMKAGEFRLIPLGIGMALILAGVLAQLPTWLRAMLMLVGTWLAVSGDFPAQLRAVLEGRPPAPGSVAAVDHAPQAGAPAWPPAPLDLRPWLALLIALVLLVERWVATGPRRERTG